MWLNVWRCEWADSVFPRILHWICVHIQGTWSWMYTSQPLPGVCSSCRWVWWMHKSKILTTNDLVLWFCPSCFLPLTINLLSVLPYLRLPGESSTVYSVVFLFCLFIHPTGQFMMCTTVLPDHHPIRVDHIYDFEEDPRKITFFKV